MIALENNDEVMQDLCMVHRNVSRRESSHALFINIAAPQSRIKCPHGLFWVSP